MSTCYQLGSVPAYLASELERQLAACCCSQIAPCSNLFVLLPSRGAGVPFLQSEYDILPCCWVMHAPVVVCLVSAMTWGVCPACMQGPAGPETQAAALAQPATVQQGAGGSSHGAQQPSPRGTGARAPAAVAASSPRPLRDQFRTQQAAQQQPQPASGDSMAVSDANLEHAVATAGRGPGAAAATSEALPHPGSEAVDTVGAAQAAGEGLDAPDPEGEDSAGGAAAWETQPQVLSAAELQQPDVEASGGLDEQLTADCAGSDQGAGLAAASGSEQGETASARGSSRSGPSLAFAARTVASLGKQEGVGQTVTAAKPVTGGQPASC